MTGECILRTDESKLRFEIADARALMEELNDGQVQEEYAAAICAPFEEWWLAYNNLNGPVRRAIFGKICDAYTKRNSDSRLTISPELMMQLVPRAWRYLAMRMGKYPEGKESIFFRLTDPRHTDCAERFQKTLEGFYPSTLIPSRYLWLRPVIKLLNVHVRLHGDRFDIADFGGSLGHGCPFALCNDGKHDVQVECPDGPLKEFLGIVTSKDDLRKPLTIVRVFDRQGEVDPDWVHASHYEKFDDSAIQAIDRMTHNSLVHPVWEIGFVKSDLTEEQDSRYNGRFHVGIASMMLYMMDRESRETALTNMLEMMGYGSVLVVIDAVGVMGVENDGSINGGTDGSCVGELFRDGGVTMRIIYKDYKNRSEMLKVFDMGEFYSYKNNTPDACMAFRPNSESWEAFEREIN